MQLQLALDLLDLKKAIRIAEKTKKYIDIVEIGTPLIKHDGVYAIRCIKNKFKNKWVVADLKTMDCGFLEVEMAFKAGADIATVCAAAGNATIKGAVKAARKYKKKVMVDLIGVVDKEKRVKEISNLGIDYICVHTGIDVQAKGITPLADLKKIINIINKKRIAVAGGINLKNINNIVKFKPAIIIVGGAITKAVKPKLVANELKEKLK